MVPARLLQNTNTHTHTCTHHTTHAHWPAYSSTHTHVHTCHTAQTYTQTPPKTSVAANIILSWQKFCRDKTSIALSRQTRVCRDKTRLLSRQQYACRDKIMFVATNICCDKSCCDKHTFVATKDTIVAAAPANDRRQAANSKHWFTTSMLFGGGAVPETRLWVCGQAGLASVCGWSALAASLGHSLWPEHSGLLWLQLRFPAPFLRVCRKPMLGAWCPPHPAGASQHTHIFL